MLQLQEPLNQQPYQRNIKQSCFCGSVSWVTHLNKSNHLPPKRLLHPSVRHHTKELINESNPWNENSTKNDKLELLKSKPCSNNSTKNDKLELMILNESNPWNEHSVKNDKLELLKFKLCSNNSIKNDKLELLILNDFKPCSNNSIKNDKLESLPKSPSATSKLKVLPDSRCLLFPSLVHSLD